VATLSPGSTAGGRHPADLYHDVVYNDSIERIDSLKSKVLCMGHTFVLERRTETIRCAAGPEVPKHFSQSRGQRAIDHTAAEALPPARAQASFAELTEAPSASFVFDLPIRLNGIRSFRSPFTGLRARHHG